jgi:Fusaric acid resistance protein-like
MHLSWSRDLYRIGTPRGAGAVTLRLLLAVAVPMLGGLLLGYPVAAFAGGATALFVTLSDVGDRAGVRFATMAVGGLLIVLGGVLGHELGSTSYARETVVLLSALLAGWASGSHPGIAVVTRFFAIAVAAASGGRLGAPGTAQGALVGAVMALVAAELAWRVFGTPAHENLIDWRAGVRRALHGSDAGMRFTLCYAAAAAIALFAARTLGVQDPAWATFVVLMVMRREGIACLELTIHYALGTILGVVIAALLLQVVSAPLGLTLLAIGAAAVTRVGFALNPSLGYLTFTAFLLFGVHLASGHAVPPHLLAARVYDVSVGCLLALAGTLAATYPGGAVPVALRGRALAARGRSPPPHSPPQDLERTAPR